MTIGDPEGRMFLSDPHTNPTRGSPFGITRLAESIMTKSVCVYESIPIHVAGDIVHKLNHLQWIMQDPRLRKQC